MKKSFLLHCVLVIGMLLLCSAVRLSPALAAEPQRVAVLPFKMNAEKDLSFLRNGIFDMLSSRLSDPEKVQVVSRTEVDKALAEETGPAATGPIDEAAARKIGQKLGADFVLFGSLTMFGNSLSIDAEMLDVAGMRPPVTASAQSADMGAVSPQIDQFAAEINSKVFNRQAPAAGPVATAPRTEAVPESRAHPEKLLQGGAVAGGTAQVSPFITRKEKILQTTNFWKSPNFTYFISGLAVGDVDGDGRQETVIVSPDEVTIYRFQNNTFSQIRRLDKVPDRYNIAVDVADINGNGRAEIFVTALNNYKNVVTSYVAEYNGNDYAVIAKDQPWYFRVTDTPARGKVLLGQQNRSNTPYKGTIYEMQWGAGAYVEQSAVRTPSGVSVLGVALGDVLNDKAETLVACNSGNNLVIATPSGDSLWKSNDKYCGSVQYYAGPKSDKGQEENPIYLPMRLLVRHQAEADLKNQVIAVNNHEVANMRWSRRDFTEANIEALVWDGVSLGNAWSTRKMSRFISDIQIADFDNDGRDELVVSLIIKAGDIILTSAKSTVIAYELDTAPQASDASGQ
ncbi:MAG: FG-GAP-like repeat-containing protein [Desulfobacterales bacterium]